MYLKCAAVRGPVPDDGLVIKQMLENFSATLSLRATIQGLIFPVLPQLLCAKPIDEVDDLVPRPIALP